MRSSILLVVTAFVTRTDHCSSLFALLPRVFQTLIKDDNLDIAFSIKSNARVTAFSVYQAKYISSGMSVRI